MYSMICGLKRILPVMLMIGLSGYAGASAAEKRLALVIGNDHYHNFGTLKNAGADARAVASKLKTLGFEVVLQLNLDSKATLRAVRQFKQQISGGDEAVFYFAGHGVQIEAANYLLPVDISAENIDQVKDDALALQRVLEDMREQKARFSLAIIDACRDNPFKGKGRAIGGRGLAPTTAANGQMVLYSAGAGQQALDQLHAQDRDPNGLFTRVLLKEIDQPGVSIDRVLRKVRDEVVRLAKSVGHDQVPALYDQSIGDFYFRPGKGTLVQGTPSTLENGAANGAVSIFKPGEILRDCDTCPEMIVIPKGNFEMGSTSFDPERKSTELPLHRVSVPAFALGKTEVTRAQFAAFIQETGYRTSNYRTVSSVSIDIETGKADSSKRSGSECFTFENGKLEKRFDRSWTAPGFAQEDSHPVSCVTWLDAKAYLAWLSQKTGQRYRLPTEAEWEYAARAGTRTARFWGNEPAQACSFANVADQVFAAHASGEKEVHACEDGFAYTAPVARFKPNAFGVYDLLGNVEEWIEDCWQVNYANAPLDGSAQMRPASGSGCSYVVRGGSWYDDPSEVRSAHRGHTYAGLAFSYFGFRAVRDLP